MKNVFSLYLVPILVVSLALGMMKYYDKSLIQWPTNAHVQRGSDALAQSQAGRIIVLQAQVTDLNSKLARLTDENTILDILECESGFRYDAINPSGARGIAQFKRATFYELARKAGFKHLIWTNPQHQVQLLRWAIYNGYAHKWECAQ